ncbi:hypothetical protein BT96DRAFT_358022 [Gymnopus androsaceus JB14]|uniref:Uncharacterized protein n=1 Tax=Gymnopus androsaceus JB14 TaxID=1447944 RepID=A0A6A4I5C7_9AGAR|nr:hypothetical protein BT96DRAFT_358022 [Gymnopus androsaceus JB14]
MPQVKAFSFKVETQLLLSPLDTDTEALKSLIDLRSKNKAVTGCGITGSHLPILVVDDRLFSSIPSRQPVIFYSVFAIGNLQYVGSFFFSDRTRAMCLRRNCFVRCLPPRLEVSCYSSLHALCKMAFFRDVLNVDATCSLFLLTTNVILGNNTEAIMSLWCI